MQNPSLSQVIGNELYISHSQINTYLSCSLRYKFQYVEKIRFPDSPCAVPL
jgi:hypothetical protein